MFIFLYCLNTRYNHCLQVQRGVGTPLLESPTAVVVQVLVLHPDEVL